MRGLLLWSGVIKVVKIDMMCWNCIHRHIGVCSSMLILSIRTNINHFFWWIIFFVKLFLAINCLISFFLNYMTKKFITVNWTIKRNLIIAWKTFGHCLNFLSYIINSNLISTIDPMTLKTLVVVFLNNSIANLANQKKLVTRLNDHKFGNQIFKHFSKNIWFPFENFQSSNRW
jgi:hypothetical protein